MRWPKNIAYGIWSRHRQAVRERYFRVVFALNPVARARDFIWNVLTARDDVTRPLRWLINVCLLIAVVLIGYVVADFAFMSCPAGATDCVVESRSAILRNLVLVLAVPVGIALAVWRSLASERQIRIQDAAQASSRFNDAATMLAKDTERLQIMGFTMMERLRVERPADYGLLVLELYRELISDAIKRPIFPIIRDIPDLPYESKFNPSINARMFNAIVNDTTRLPIGTDEYPENFFIKDSKFGEVVFRPNDWEKNRIVQNIYVSFCFFRRFVPAVRDRPQLVHDCYIEQLELTELASSQSNSSFYFENCVFRGVNIWAPKAGREEDKYIPEAVASLKRHFTFVRCRLSDESNFDLDETLADERFLNSGRLFVGDYPLDEKP